MADAGKEFNNESAKSIESIESIDVELKFVFYNFAWNFLVCGK